MPKRILNQRYIAMFEDSPRIKNLIHPNISKNYFNWTMTYRRDSDIYNPYGRFVSNENPSEEIMKQIGYNLQDMHDMMERKNFMNKKTK